MTRRFSFLTSRSLLTVAAILQVTPHSVSGGVGSSHHASQAQPQSQAATILATVNNTSDKGNPNPGIHPINSKPYGLSYSEWSARWWQWLLQIPAATNPNLDATGANCAEGQLGHVWFLAGSFGPLTISFPINRFCTVPTWDIFFVTGTQPGGWGRAHRLRGSCSIRCPLRGFFLQRQNRPGCLAGGGQSIPG